MSSRRPTKRLTYIVNYLSAHDVQHYVHIPNLLSEVEKLGWDVDFVSERGGQGRSQALGRPVTYLSRNARWGRLLPLVVHLLKMRLGGGRLVFVRISKSAAILSALLGRLFGWRTIYWISGTVEDFNMRGGLRARLGLAGMWCLFRLVDRLATGPETMVRYYSARYGLPERKIMLLYNDIDLVGAAPMVRRDETARVLLVHRLSPVRETDRYFPILLKALASYAERCGSSVVLDICGDGPERPVLERIAKSAPSTIDIRFHGAVPQRELGQYYARATIFVMPSYREGFPRVMIEAMARGLPIVATNAGGTSDLCGPAQQSYVVDREDPVTFGQAVERLLSSADDRQRLSTENLASVRRFGSPQVARMYDRALSELIGAAPAP
jgi:glycosyltransferase involved in cell wall biosynthesis